MPVQVSRRDGIAIVLMANGAVNALSMGNGFVEELSHALRELEKDPTCTAIVLVGAGRMFCGGADISDFDHFPLPIDKLHDLLGFVEGAQTPIIAAIHGMALGGGLELALAAHCRIATRDARLGLPEVKLGLLPGGGGTQRLPRLVGVEAALDMMLSGNSISGTEAARLGLVDALADDVVEAAIQMVLAKSVKVRRTRGLPIPGGVAKVIDARRALIRGECVEAKFAMLDCVGALSTDLETGLAVESERFKILLRTGVSRGLRHAFIGERTVARIPIEGAVQTGSSDIHHAGVIGGGLMGTGIAIALLNAGLSVTVVEQNPEALARSESMVRSAIERDIEKGRISRDAAAARLKGFTPAASLETLADTELVIEAVFEDLALKARIFEAAEAIVRPDTILASNTSTLDLNLIAAAVRDPSRVVGLHFFSPANVMRLLEIVRGQATSPNVLARAMALGKQLGKVSVVSGVCDGFIGNRMFEEYLRQVWFLLEEGALPHQIDTALEHWGMAMGPCRTMDMVGQDIGWAIRKRRALEQPERPYSGVIDRICERGYFGQKTSRGIYRYQDGRTAETDPEIERLIVDYSAQIGLKRRTIGGTEIVERCLLALVNEGARIVGEGIAYRPVDVDMVFLHGYGFPRARGGPMFQADDIGARKLLDRLVSLSRGRHGWAWTPAPLIETLAATSRGFSTLNA